MSDQHENALPEAVRRQVATADAIIAQMNAEQTGTPPADPAPADPAPAPAPADPAPADPAPAPADPAPADPAPADPTPADPAARTDWKQKFHVLQGKYNAEVPRLHADLREASTTITGMRDQLNSLQATVASIQEVNKKPAEPAAPLVSQEEIEQFGPDLIDVVERVARQAVAPYVDQKFGEVAASVKQVGEKTSNLETGVAESARIRLYERLDGAVPNWEVINKDPTFLNWLNGEDGLSGQLRGVILRGAFDRNDAERVVKIFKGFQKEHAVENSDPSPATPANDPPADPKPEPQQSLDELVAPGTPKTGSTGAQEEAGKGRIWTQADITSFYERKNELIKKNPNAELPDNMKALERDLFKAQNEGRIRN